MALGTGHRQRDQHDRHRAFDQRNLDDLAMKRRQIDQCAGNHCGQGLGQIEQAVDQQYIAQLHGANAQ
ncbi:hypothetical protein D3C75_1238010 [compost metagenome]